MDSRLRPFELKRVQFNYCREFTMQRAAYMLTPLIIFNYRQPHTKNLIHENESTAIVANMYYWRKYQPFLLIENLKENFDFR